MTKELSVTLYDRRLTCPNCENRYIRILKIIKNNNHDVICGDCNYAFEVDFKNAKISSDCSVFLTGKELGWKCDNCDNIVEKKKDLYEQEEGKYDDDHFHYCINCHITKLERELSCVEELKEEIAKLKAKREKQ